MPVINNAFGDFLEDHPYQECAADAKRTPRHKQRIRNRDLLGRSINSRALARKVEQTTSEFDSLIM